MINCVSVCGGYVFVCYCHCLFKYFDCSIINVERFQLFIATWEVDLQCMYYLSIKLCW